MNRSFAAIVMFVMFCVLSGLLAGCGDGKTRWFSQSNKTAGDTPVPPPAVEGTIAEFAYLDGGADLLIRGYGLVVGLGGNGSRECPEPVRRAIAEQMMRYRQQSGNGVSADVSADRMIDDMDTGVVVISAAIPPGVPVGTKVDAYVQALPGTQTTSLDGGTLMTADMTQFDARRAGTVESRAFGAAHGAIFVNPFADTTSPSVGQRLREGRIIGGCTTTESRAIRLILRQADYGRAQMIQNRINERFDSIPKVASAKDPTYIDLRIPKAYRNDYKHFLQLITHLYLNKAGGMQDQKAMQLTKDILLPTAQHEDIALVWEAMGRQVAPMLRDLYKSDNVPAAYYAARAGSRLGDLTARDVLIQAARTSGSPYQFDAIAELSTVRDLQAFGVLKELLDSNNELVRVAAYEALCACGYQGAVQRTNVDDQFTVDVVPSGRDFVIYATQTGTPRLVFFGQAVRVRQPVFFTSPDGILTLHAEKSDKLLHAFRKVGAQKRLSEVFDIPFDVPSLVKTLGQIPTKGADGKARGLGLTYSQVVGVLYRLCDEKDKTIPAKFVLQRTDELKRILQGTSAVGRPDSAGTQ